MLIWIKKGLIAVVIGLAAWVLMHYLPVPRKLRLPIPITAFVLVITYWLIKWFGREPQLDRTKPDDLKVVSDCTAPCMIVKLPLQGGPFDGKYAEMRLPFGNRVPNYLEIYQSDGDAPGCHTYIRAENTITYHYTYSIEH